MSKFNHTSLPYLFGVTVGEELSLITSYHGLNEESVTLHLAVHSKPEVTRKLLDDGNTWINILTQITNGLNSLHSEYKLLHNDLKMDNICLTSSLNSQLQAVIIDFGKACDIHRGKLYRLTENEKEHYKIHHAHIAPDLRDGVCRQSTQSDIYSLGRILNLVNNLLDLQNEDLKQLSDKCMQYHNNLHPNMVAILNYLIH